jgi:hypothetical protein
VIKGGGLVLGREPARRIQGMEDRDAGRPPGPNIRPASRTAPSRSSMSWSDMKKVAVS